MNGYRLVVIDAKSGGGYWKKLSEIYQKFLIAASLSGLRDAAGIQLSTINYQLLTLDS